MQAHLIVTVTFYTRTHTCTYTAILATKANKKQKAKVRAMPLVINATGTDDSIYEAVGGEYEAIPAGLDYTLPTPSPTVKYNPKTEEVFIPDGNGPLYHAEGPDVGNHYDYCGTGTVYNTLEPETSNQYEAPMVPKFRVSDCMFVC